MTTTQELPEIKLQIEHQPLSNNPIVDPFNTAHDCLLLPNQKLFPT